MKNKTNWYSTMVRLVCLIENIGATRYMDSIYIFKAVSFEEAFQIALEIGKKQEEEYVNADGLKVRWRLKEIFSLDNIGDESLDRCEVYSAPVSLKDNENYDFDFQFTPENSETTQTI